MERLLLLWFFCLGVGLVRCRDNYSEPGIPVDYSVYVSDSAYSSNGTARKFDAKGMSPLYAVVDLFMNLVGSNLKKDIPADLIPAEDGNIGDVYAYAKQWMSFERGVVICAGIGVGLAILVPVVGLLFCCCRCCGQCGANAKKTDRNSDPCRCGSLTILFVLLCLVMTFGVICSLVTNEYMRTNVQRVNSTAKDSVKDLREYLKDSQRHASYILVQNFDELKAQISGSLNDTEVTSERLFDDSVDFVGADDLFSYGDQLTRADKGIGDLNVSFSKLKSLEATLRDNVTTIRQWVSDILASCSNEVCSKISAAENALQLGIDFSDLTISAALADLEKRISPSLVAQIREARFKLNSVRSTLTGELHNASDVVKDRLAKVQEEVRMTELRIRQQTTDADTQLSRLDLSPYFDYVYQYNQYIWYGKLAACVLVLLILVIFILAALFGISGSRIGSLYEDPFCNKGKGACLMMCGVGLVFVLYFFLAIGITALFIVGINLQLLGCDSVSNPTSTNHLKVLGIVLQQYRVSDLNLKEIPQMLQKCHNNEGIYNVFNLNDTYNINGVMEKRVAEMNIEPAVAGFVDEAARRIKNTKFLSVNDRAALLNLADSPYINQVNLDFLKLKLSNKDIFNGPLDRIINETVFLRSFFPDTSVTVGKTHQIVRELEYLQSQLIPQIDAEKATALTIVNDLSVMLEQRNASEDIRRFVNLTDIAETRFHEHSEPIIRGIANDTVDNLERFISQYTNYSKLLLMNDVGRCQPVSRALNATSDAVCVEVMRPFNGYWLSIGWFLIVLLPLLPIAIALAWHYRLPESFRSSSSDSSDYETQTEIDTIPLAHRQARRRVQPSTLDNAAYDSRARQSKATQWAFHNAFKNQSPSGYSPVRKGVSGPSAPADDVYTRPPSYYYPGSNS